MMNRPLTQNTFSRPRVFLHGEWSYLVDPYETGYRHQRDWVPFDAEVAPEDRAFFLDGQRTRPDERLEYDFAACPRMNVPGDWNHQVECIRYYEGMVWFQRTFDYDLAAGRRLFLRFEAVNYECEVYLNGRSVGCHVGGFDPFEFELTDRLRADGNRVVVRVNNRREKDTVPGMTTDWWNYGGITREVFLFEVPEVFLRDYHLQLRPGEGEVAFGEFRVDGADGPVEIHLAIPELEVKTTLRTDGDGCATCALPLPGLERWSPQAPRLYPVEMNVGADRLTDRIGFRTIETRGPDLLLNGESVFLRGISMHEEVARVPRRAWSREDAAELLDHAKELNCNFVRLAHYPHNEYMARLADERGILLWEEIPVYWGIDYAQAKVFASAAGQLESLVRRDRNRASVIIWSIANETPVTESRLRFLRRLRQIVRSLDPHRLVSAALDRTESEDGRRFAMQDPFAQDSDLVSCNQYLGWYYGTPEACREVRWELDAAKPFFGSEFGAGALYGRHGPKEEVWTEEHQAWLYEEQIAMFSRLPTFRGFSPWILMDFRSPRRNLTGVQDHWNRKGLIDPQGRKKMAWYVLKAFYDRMERETRAAPATARGRAR